MTQLHAIDEKSRRIHCFGFGSKGAAPLVCGVKGRFHLTCIRVGVVVPTENLNRNVAMMQTAEEWNRRDAADQLRAPKIRRVFIQGEMSADLVAG